MKDGRPVAAPAGRQATVELLVTFRTPHGADSREVENALTTATRRVDAALEAAMQDLRTEVEVEDVSLRDTRSGPRWPVACDGVLYRDASEIAGAAMAAGRQAGVPQRVHDATGRAFAVEAWASVRRPFAHEGARASAASVGDAC